MSPAICFNFAQSKFLSSGHGYTFSQTTPGFHDPEEVTEKGKNADEQHFLLFPQCFLPIRKRISV